MLAPAPSRRDLLAITMLLVVFFLTPSLEGGENRWTSIGPEGGAVTALAAPPYQSQLLYAGTRTGKLYRSLDGGQTWAFRGVGLEAYEILSISVDPFNEARVVAGGRRIEAPSAGAVLVSPDGGGTWTRISGTLGDPAVQVVLADPGQAGAIWAATPEGIFRSEDEGLSWSPRNAGLTDKDVRALVADPAIPSTLHCGTATGGVFQTLDTGGVWTAVNQGLADTRIRALTLNPLSPDTLYAGTLAGGVFRTDTGGASWIEANNGLTDLSIRALALDPNESHHGLRGNGLGRFPQPQ